MLSLIAVLACLEELSARPPAKPLTVMAVLIVVFAALCVWSLGCYHALLARALYLGERSTCSRCGVAGAVEILRSGNAAGEADGDLEPWLKVRCRRCSHQCTIE